MPRFTRKRAEPDGEEDRSGGRRPVWSGSVSFGIVSIAVRMFTAVREHGIHFHQISRNDRKRIRYLKVAEGTTDEVPAADIIKGFQIPDGSYVTFDDDELTSIAARKSRIIDIESFVALSEIDPRHFDRPYYLLPTDENADKPYHLLVEALERSDRVGIAQMVMHNKEYLVAVRSIDGTLCVETLHFSDEIVDPDELRRQRRIPSVGERELKMADQLISSMSAPFKATAYRDSYLDRLRAAIQRKSKGKTLQLEEAEDAPDEGKVLDLMEALRRSVEKTRGAGKAKASPPAKAAPQRRSRKVG